MNGRQDVTREKMRLRSLFIAGSLLFLLCLGCGSDGRYLFYGPEDSPEKYVYINEMDPIYKEGVEIQRRLKRSLITWANQVQNPDWDTFYSEFDTLVALIEAQHAKASDIVPKREDLERPHAQYLEAWTLCLDGLKMVFTFIESRGEQGSYVDATTLIQKGIDLFDRYPGSLARQAVHVRL